MLRPVHLTCLCVLFAGCQFGPGRIEVPQLKPTEVAECIVVQCDRDRNAVLSMDETSSCPALRSSFDRYDADRDGSLTTDEIAARFQAMLDSRVGRMPCMCTVYWNGRPVANAKVDLIPETCWADAIQPATAETNDKGIAKPVTIDAPAGVPGVQLGLYRVRITHPEWDVPAEYNDETTLGFELSPLERDGDTAEFHLTRN